MATIPSYQNHLFFKKKKKSAVAATNKLKNRDNIKTIKYELDKLNKIVKKKKLSSKQIKKEFLKLKKINLRLWNIEDKKRKYEKQKKFDIVVMIQGDEPMIKGKMIDEDKCF